MLPLWLFACAWEPPVDPDAPPVLNVVSGQVLVTGAPATAPTFVLVFDAANPGPPDGTGSPLTFASVPGEAYTGEGAGIQSADYAVTQLADGDYLLNALMDVDGDFQPFLSSNAGATCGDWVGAHVADLATGEPAVVSVSGGVELDDVTIAVGYEMTTERPAFTLSAPTISQTSTDLQLFHLDSTGIYSQVVTLEGPFDGTDPCGTYFLFYAVDADADGAPDPHPEPALAAAGAYDIWPRVYLQYLGTDLEAGESWAAEAVVYPGVLLTGQVPVGVPTPVTGLDLVWVPAALHTLPDGTEEVVTPPNLPAGAWSITVVSITGQTWTVPNELPAFPATDAAFDPATQGASLLVE